MRTDLTLVTDTGVECDVAILAPGPIAFAQISDRLRTVAGVQPSLPMWSHGELLDDGVLVGSLALPTGSLVRVGARPRPESARASMLALRVISGPDSGMSIDLPAGSIAIGRAPDCDLVLTDPDVSRAHARVTVGTNGVRVEDLGSTNTTTVDGVAVGGCGAPLHDDGVLRIGDTLLALTRPVDPPARTHAVGESVVVKPLGGRSDNESLPEFRLPTRSDPAHKGGFPVLPTVIALGVAVAMGLVLRSPQLLVLAAAMPLVTFIATGIERLRMRQSSRRSTSDHEQARRQAESSIASALREEANQRRRAMPDAASVMHIATTPSVRIWERRASDSNFLEVRVGTGDLPSLLVIHQGDERLTRTLRSVPVLVDLRAGPVGMSGPIPLLVRISNYLLCQLGALCSPAELEIAGWFSASATERWHWLRWLPHVRRPPATTAADKRSFEREVARLVRGRRANRASGDQWCGPRLVVLVDDDTQSADSARFLESVARDGSAVGITAVILHGPQPPPYTANGAQICIAGETGNRVEVRRDAGALQCVADAMQGGAAEQVARALAPLIESEIDRSTGVPDECQLLDLLGIQSAPNADMILTRWRSSCGRPRTVLGAAAIGAVTVDLTEDGPHALVAGTTGSGKSELLKALVVGIAASHPPESVSFVLIDYKGGAAFSDCARLPHVAGLITDLDASLTARALRSLGCEIRRRESLFAAVGATDIESYWTTGSAELPRLVLVVDEFAALAEELPDFLRGLVGIAQRGRSLGLHLVLATQRPGGVVSAEIRANSSLRIALRVNDANESRDVIGHDAAAAIDPGRPGRAFMWTGSQLTQLQVAGVSCTSSDTSDTIRVERLDPWRQLPNGCQARSESRPPDLTLLVDAVVDAATASGRLPTSTPWHQPLPDRVHHNDLPETPRRSVIHVGLHDLPDQQAQPATSVDLDRGGTILLVGSARSGRTTAARCVALAGAAQLTPEQLHIYAIGADVVDLGGLAHCGTALDLADIDTVGLLLRRFEAQLADRRAVNAARRLLILDGWEPFVEAADQSGHSECIDAAIRIARQGGSTGATVVVTGDRAALGPQLSGVAHAKYLLRLADVGDYGLAGLDRRAIPRRMPAGRALAVPGGAETQFALPPPLTASPPGPRATDGTRSGVIRLRALPSMVRLHHLPRVRERFLIGLGGDLAEPVTVDLRAGHSGLLITGPPQSGRTTALRLLLCQAIDRAKPVVVATARSPSLDHLALRHGIAVTHPQDDAPVIRPETVVFVDDMDAFVHTRVGDTIAALLADHNSRVAVVATGRSDDVVADGYRIVNGLRPSARQLILHPPPTAAAASLGRFGRTKQPPGRGVLVNADGPTGVCHPIPVQVAFPDDE